MYLNLPTRFKINRTVVVLFWLIVIGVILGIYFFAPTVFYRITQMPYQDTPFVNTPNR